MPQAQEASGIAYIQETWTLLISWTVFRLPLVAARPRQQVVGATPEGILFAKSRPNRTLADSRKQLPIPNGLREFAGQRDGTNRCDRWAMPFRCDACRRYVATCVCSVRYVTFVRIRTSGTAWPMIRKTVALAFNLSAGNGRYVSSRLSIGNGPGRAA